MYFCSDFPESGTLNDSGNIMKRLFQTLLLGLMAMTAMAQLSSNKDKFLGNITTTYQVDYGNEAFYTLWNQITPENETKWDAIEGRGRGQFTFDGADNSANYAAQHGFIFKYHTLIWGSQYPGWVNNLSTNDQYSAIVEYFNAVKQHYPNLAIIDVVNEAIVGHAPAPYKDALGGDGKTGYDWIIKAFELAHERWPDAILVYNDFNTFRWQKSEFIDLVRTIRDAGAPVDAYGCQSHDLTDMEVSEFKSAMDEIQNALKMPMYSTEYDIGTNDDNLQLQRYQEQIPYVWEKDYCAGITLWGYIYGKTWTGKEEEGTKGNSGLIRDGQDRPAMTWLREYMASDKAKNAKSPFPGMKKEISLYVKPASLSAIIGEALPITVTAQLTAGSTKTIQKVELYINDKLHETSTTTLTSTEYTPTATGKHNLKAVVTTDDGKTYERLSSFTAYKPRGPYKGVIDLPGTIEGEDFDTGAEGIASHDSDSQNQGSGATYRSDAGSVDIESINGGYAIGWTHAGEWLEYTVNVTEAGLYEYDVYVSSQDGGGAFSFAMSGDDGLTDLTGTVNVAKTGAWSTYKVQHGRFTKELAAGQQRLRFIVEKGDQLFNFDKIIIRKAQIIPRKPFNDIAIELPGTLEVEDFDQGGEGIAFHDADSENEGTSAYRQDGEGVDIVGANNGYGIGYTATDEWLEYTVNVKEAGNYRFEALVASGLNNTSFSLSLNKNNELSKLTETVVVPNTDSWNTYTTVAGTLLMPLEEGQQIIRLTITGGYCNIDKIVFKSLKGDVSNDGDVDEQDVAELSDLILGGESNDEDIDLGHTPFCDMELPGTIEAENFDRGGEGVAYHDSDDTDNEKVGYRSDNGGVDINHGAPNGGYAIGYTPEGEWLEYTVNVKEDGIYSFEAFVSSGYETSSFTLSLHTDEGLTALTDEVSVTSGGQNDWNTYTTSEGRLLVPLQKGRQVIRLTIIGGWCNIDKIIFTHVAGTSKGDLNGDGEVDIVDITKLIEIVKKQK